MTAWNPSISVRKPNRGVKVATACLGDLFQLPVNYILKTEAYALCGKHFLFCTECLHLRPSHLKLFDLLPLTLISATGRNATPT